MSDDATRQTVPHRCARRIARRSATPPRATRWPDAETVDDWSQGVAARLIRTCAAYWADGYDWRARERLLNRFDQFLTDDRRARHPLHPSARPTPTPCPLVITHGWPGSIVEFHKVIEPLTDPTALGGDAADAFHVVCPTLPGFGFSGKPTAHGLGRRADRRGVGRADGPARLRPLRRPGRRLGLGRDPAIGAQDAGHCAAIHITLAMGTRPRCDGDADAATSSGPSKAPSTTRRGTRATRSSRRPARRRSATAWPIHRPGRRRGSWRSSGRGPTATATPRTCSRRDELLDNVMLYWATNSASARHASTGRASARPAPPRCRCRSASPSTRRRSSRPVRSLDGGGLPDIVYWSEQPKGRPLRRLRAARPVRRRPPDLLPPVPLTCG